MGMSRRGNMRQQQRMAMRMGNMGMRNRAGVPGSEYHSKTGHSVHMRGLPFQAQDSDIQDVRHLSNCCYVLEFKD